MSLIKRQLRATGLCRLDTCNNSERSSNRFIRASNEAPYQTIGRRTLKTTLGYKELFNAHFWLSILSECLSSYLYVFVVCSTRISWTGAIIGHEPNLLAMSLSAGISMMLLIFTFRTVHVNPALTISFLSTGRIPLCRAILYVIVHCFGSIAAIAFLYSISIKGHAGALGLDKPHDVLNDWQILIVEIVISFFVTLATYATCNYSSYTCAKRHILDQLGEDTNLLSVESSDNNLTSHSDMQPPLSFSTQVRPHHLRRPVAPIVPEQTSFRTLQPGCTSNVNQFGMASNVKPLSAIPFGGTTSVFQEDNSDFEYDNHRIYATQLQRPSASPQVSIEESMQDECRLLAPNGFSLHMTSGQALVIGLAYTLASLTGIPASGASLNPARSLGPAFIMNRWDRHWIYWLGPILGAVVAGFFYEFIFNPTRESSLCYRPKLFRLSAQDMAKVGSKSRLYQQNRKFSPQATIVRPSTTTICRPQLHNNNIQTLHQSPNTRQPNARPQMPSNLINNTDTGLMKPTMINPASISQPMCSNLEQMYFMQQQHQNRQQTLSYY